MHESSSRHLSQLALRRLTSPPQKRLAAFVLLFLCCCLLVADASVLPVDVKSAKVASASRSPRLSPLHPRDYYFGAYNIRCSNQSTLLKTAAQLSTFPKNNSGVEEFISPECFTGRGVKVAILDTGLCAHVSRWSRDAITCTSVVPGVACDDAGCEHGTRTASVLGGHLLPPVNPSMPFSFKETESTGNATSAFSRRQYSGMAPHAAVRVFRIFDRQHHTRARYSTAALDVLIEEAELYAQKTSGQHDRKSKDKHSTAGPAPVDIVSLSYGGEDYYGNAEVQERLQTLMHRYGVLVIVAAGNAQPRFGSVISPADVPGVLAVGAVKAVRRKVHTTGEGASKVSMVHREDAREGAKQMISFDKSVALFSGRGPTTWELPFGAGRVAPQLMALGQHVLAVNGVTSCESPINTSSASTQLNIRASSGECGAEQQQQLRLRSVSGTSFAAPIVAGAAAAVLEAVRWAEVKKTPSSPPPRSVETPLDSDVVYWDLRRRQAHRVQQLLLQTASLLPPSSLYMELGNTALPTVAAEASNANSSDEFNTTGATSQARLLAGLPLTQLYVQHLARAKWSIQAQGLGEMQPRRALQAVLSSIHRGITSTPCVSFSIPPALVIGGGSVADGDDDDDGAGGLSALERDDLPHGESGTRGWSREALDTYWWPYSDMVAYPGAVPLLFNLSLHLCHAPRAQRSVAPGKNAASELDIQFHVREVIGRSRLPTNVRSGSDLHCVNATCVLFSDAAKASAEARNARVEKMLKKHLLRVALDRGDQVAPSNAVKTKKAAVASVNTTLPKMTTTASLSSSSLSLLALSVALYVPPTVHTRLRYCGTGSVATTPPFIMEVGEDTEGCSTCPTCAPLFHRFSDVLVRGEVRVRDLQEKDSGETSTTQSALLVVVPLTLRIRAPPPRSQRVLIDTSLDWFGPTAASSDLFIAGDDPHEHFSGASADSGARHAYDEAGGDHPHTNLALLHTYLQHSLGLAVTYFPLLHVATSVNVNGAGAEGVEGLPPRTLNATTTRSTKPTKDAALPSTLAAAAKAVLSDVGTLLIVDPERPLVPAMRSLLTDAVLPAEGKDGLHVVLITDWYSEEMASAMRWAREVGELRTGSEVGVDDAAGRDSTFRTRCDEGDCAPAVAQRGRNALLRAWVAAGVRRNASDNRASPARGLGGSCHVPSLNSWLRELASAAHGSPARAIPAVTETNKSADVSRGAPMFLFSEDMVLDGALAVSASSLPETNNASSQNCSFSPMDLYDDEKPYRILGVLNGAGVLQWSRADTTPLEKKVEGGGVNATDGDARSASGEAVLCNTMPTSSLFQYQLRKHRPADADDPPPLHQNSHLNNNNKDNNSSRTDGADDDSNFRFVETYDSFESLLLPNPAATTTMDQQAAVVAHVDGVVAASISSTSSSSSSAFGQRGTDTSASLPFFYGVLGFLTLPSSLLPHAARDSNATRVFAAHKPRPGRVAIFTDSNCLSADDAQLQDAVRSLDRLLSDFVFAVPQAASNDDTSPQHNAATMPLRSAHVRQFWESSAGASFVRVESVESSTCVEVVKELLYWTLSGDLDRWTRGAGLQCERRTWPPSANRPEGASAASTSHDDRPNVGENGQHATEIRSINEEDLMHTAPERAAVGELVARLWVATVDSDDTTPIRCKDVHEATSAAIKLRLEDNNNRSSSGSVAKWPSQNFTSMFIDAQRAAAEAVQRALAVQYHGEWDEDADRARKEKSFIVASSKASDSGGAAETVRKTSGRGRSVRRDELGFWKMLDWLWHPVIIAQVVFGIVAFMGYAIFVRIAE